MSRDERRICHHGGDCPPKSPHGMTIMRMSSIKFLALAVLVIVVLLTLAEFGPAVLSGR
jgi:hypothetical protein